ncbi:hypothetical protein BCR33DRAFT_723489 [Rhizoclosmatium globosum]|uniref:Uncharacterized protein n=1 Tax=Rhizoclosmatium globosum TaxID=329046 RepID=A0A1Y2BCB8_9FUNG|nr:hypothetical protein BCR33DRAFT_723489 [Rhizoclosmatium globosum]|eukprot:ORY32469.1 hypothetical protein BCR33DRAFT_723489 [Rhizoclosmatium globosum]
MPLKPQRPAFVDHRGRRVPILSLAEKRRFKTRASAQTFKVSRPKTPEERETEKKDNEALAKAILNIAREAGVKSIKNPAGFVKESKEALRMFLGGVIGQVAREKDERQIRRQIAQAAFV